MPDVQSIARELQMLALEFKLRHSAYVNWGKGDVVKVMPIERALQRAYPMSDITRDVESVMTDIGGKSDHGVYKGISQGGQRVQFYGWQVIDKDSRFASRQANDPMEGLPPEEQEALMNLMADLVPEEVIETEHGPMNVYRINLGMNKLASKMEEHVALTQPLRSQRDYGTVEEEDEAKTAATEKGAVVRVEAKDNEWVLHFKESYRLKNADLSRLNHHVAELAQKADTVADAVTRIEMSVDYDVEDQADATKITAGEGVVQLENVVRLQWNGSVNTTRMREELKSAAEFQGFKVFEY